MCFTPFLSDLPTRQVVGWSIIAIVGGHLLYSILYILFINGKAVRHHFILWRLI